MNTAEILKTRILAQNPRPTLAVAESLTAGCLSALIASVDGASDYFLGGITCYSNAQKIKHLGLDAGLVNPVNGVSQQVAAGMARGALALFGSDIALATTGYATPFSKRQVVAPLAFWALARRLAGGGLSERGGCFHLPVLPRVEVQRAVAEMLLRELLGSLSE
jgi:nicotinamide-nucleotide amidase